MTGRRRVRLSSHNRPMRILFVSSLYSTPLLPERGIGNARIVRALRAHADIRVISPVPWYPTIAVQRFPALRALAHVPRGELGGDGEAVEHPRVFHVPVAGRALAALFHAASLHVSFTKAVRDFRPEAVVVAPAYPDAAAVVALTSRSRLPTVVRVMGTDINDVANRLGRRSQIAWTLRHAARVIAVSEALASKVRAFGVRDEQVAVIPTGVDGTAFRPVDRVSARRTLGLPAGPLIVVPARLSPEKGLDHFLDALVILTKARPVTAVLVGNGPQRSALLQRAASMGLEQHIRFAGFQPTTQMPLYYSAADLVCLPSLREGWPDVLVESFACGCPVVASAVGGVPDIVRLTGSGLTVPPGDAPALAAALDHALAVAWDRAETAWRMREHSLDATARRYLATCEEAVNHRPPPSPISARIYAS